MPKKLETLSDLDLMPFGKYYRERKKMQDVPASYLHYLWSKDLKADLELNTPAGKVARYIQQNIAHMKKEYPDGIWT